MEFELNPIRTEWDEEGNELRQEYKYVPPKDPRTQKGYFEKVGKPILVQRATTGRDKIALQREIVRMKAELLKIDAVDYDDTMKMGLVRAIEDKWPEVAKRIRAMETASEQGKKNLKKTIASYIDLLIDSGDFTEAEIAAMEAEVGGGETTPTTTPTRDYGPDPLGIFSEVP